MNLILLSCKKNNNFVVVVFFLFHDPPLSRQHCCCCWFSGDVSGGGGVEGGIIHTVDCCLLFSIIISLVCIAIVCVCVVCCLFVCFPFQFLYGWYLCRLQYCACVKFIDAFWSGTCTCKPVFSFKRPKFLIKNRIVMKWKWNCYVIVM